MIFIPQNIWEKQLIHFSVRNFSCHKAHCFKSKLVLHVGRANNIELSMLVLDFMVKCRLKNTR